MDLRNKLQWNFNQNSGIFTQENAFENVVCETAAILSGPQCINEFFIKFRMCFFGMGLQEQIWNLLYLSQKWFDCHETRSKHIDWTLGLKWDHRVDLGHDLDLEFSRSNMEFAISQPKMVWLPRNKKQTYRLNTRPQMWPSGLTMTMTMTLNFHGQIWNFLYLCQKWSGCHETNSKHIN